MASLENCGYNYYTCGFTFVTKILNVCSILDHDKTCIQAKLCMFAIEFKKICELSLQNTQNDSQIRKNFQ